MVLSDGRNVLIILKSSSNTSNVPCLNLVVCLTVNFLNPNIKLWKYEDGFNQNFCDWIEDNFGYKIQPVKQKKDKSLDNYEKVTLTLKQLDVIKNMYKLDFEVWDKFK